MKKLLITVLASVGIISAGFANTLSTNTFPSKPVTIVVPYGPGGGNDLMARIMSKSLSEQWNKSVVVLNKPGASTSMGTDYVARAVADGYTLMIAASVDLPGTPQSIPVTYKWDKDFQTIGYLGVPKPFVVVVNAKSNIHTLSEFRAHYLTQPIFYSSAGANGIYDIYGAEVLSALELKAIHVPYKSGSNAVQAVLSGEVGITVAPLVQVLQHINTGKLTALAVIGNDPIPELPGIAPMARLGYTKFNTRRMYYSMFAPTGIPAGVLTKLRRDVAIAFNNIKDQLVDLDMVDPAMQAPKYLTPGFFDDTQINAENAQWVGVIKHLHK